MDNVTREEHYRRQRNGGELTGPQRRRIKHKRRPQVERRRPIVGRRVEKPILIDDPAPRRLRPWQRQRWRRARWEQ